MKENNLQINIIFIHHNNTIRRGESHSPSHNTDKFPMSKNDNLATQETKKTKQFAKNKKGFGANKRSEPNDIN